MERKIVFFDIDGTLLSEITGEISETAITAIHKAQENGHLAVINTGRTWPLIEQRLLDIGFDAYICGCGTKIVYKGETLFHQTVEDETAQKIIAATKKYKIDNILEGDQGLYMDKKEEMLTETWRNFSSRFDGIAAYWGEPGMKMDKMFTLTNPESDLESFCKEMEDTFDCIDREHGHYEFVPKNCSKASAIQQLIDYLGMELKDTISIGDSNNDLPMLNYTAISIAMGVHSKGLEEKVDYVTKTVEENGIYHALYHYGLI